MAGELTLTLIGNLTASPELRFTASGTAVVSLTVASTPRTFKDGKWEDGQATFIRCTAWKQMAENIAESLDKGSRVIVTGRFSQRSYETKEGEKRTTYELQIDDIGPSLKFHAAQISKADRGSGKSADNPWDTAVPASAASTSGGGFSEDPPF